MLLMAYDYIISLLCKYSLNTNFEASIINATNNLTRFDDYIQQ